MKINGETKIYGIAGDPVAHSLSPLLHNHCIGKNKINAKYIPLGGFLKNPKSLSNAIRAFSIKGLSVTIPYKEFAFHCADKLHLSAGLAGSANTLLYNKKTDCISAYNTDGQGALLAIKNQFFQNNKNDNTTDDKVFNDSYIFIFGNGGTARGLLSSLYSEKPKAVFILGRNPQNVELFKKDFCSRLKKNNISYNDNITNLIWDNITKLDFPNFVQSLNSNNQANISGRMNAREKQNLLNISHSILNKANKIFLINTTPIGMNPKAAETNSTNEAPFPLSQGFIQENMLLFDAVYKPKLTPFLKLGKEKNCKLIYGQEMLLYQALEQMRLFYELHALPPADEYRELLDF